MVCASNMNRSMEAHALLQQSGLDTCSFGVGRHVKLPGPSVTQPNVYEFGTPYADILKDLTAKDEQLYARTGLLTMLQRNMSVKVAPERWQDSHAEFDIAVTFEQRVMDQLVADMSTREKTLHPLLVINFDVKDNQEEAANAAPQALRVCQLFEASDEGWLDEVDSIIEKFQSETGQRVTYTVCFF